MKKIKTLSRLLRVNNWSKNILIFLPSFFGKKLLSYQVVSDLILSFVIFSLLSSVVYIINDLSDVNSDRRHPIKKCRPIASGEVKVNNTIAIGIILLLASFLLTFFFINSLIAILLLTFYLVYNILYTFFLKNILIIEFYSIAVFFEIRLFYGGICSDIHISHWLALIIFFLATLIAIGKRRDDVIIQVNSEQKIRANTKQYNLIFFDAIITIISALLVFIYIIYSVSDWVINYYSQYFYLTDIFVILGLTKYLHIIFVEKKSGDPVKILFNDRFILICLLFWGLFVFKFIYYG